MRIALSGYYGFDNAGDEALLSAITSSIKKYAVEAEFVVFSGAPQHTMRLHGIRAVYYLNPLQIFKELWQADLLISGGGSIFQDVTSARSLPYYISVVALARLLGKPVIFYAQGVGPINRRFSKFLMRLVANRVNLITLRDMASLDYLRQLGVNNPSLMVTADPVFSLEPDPTDITHMTELLKELNPAGKALVGVSVRKWNALEGYQSILAQVLDNLTQQGYQTIFIPMAYPDDISEAHKVAALMQEKVVIIEEHLSSQEHLALIAQLDIMIGMRLHALIFAASRGIPFAGISYDPKVDAFLQIFSLEPLPLKVEEMQAYVDELLKNENLHTHIKKLSLDLREKAGQNARLALSLIKD
jgi:polysaccharide pyruvyl transferase CsaB